MIKIVDRLLRRYRQTVTFEEEVPLPPKPLEDPTGLAEELINSEYQPINLAGARIQIYTNITSSKTCPVCNKLIFTDTWEQEMRYVGNQKIFECKYCKTEFEIL